MSFGLDLNLSVGLEQKLSPQMIQSLKLLQMNSMELEMVVKQELESNPLLDILEDGETSPETDSEVDAANGEEPANKGEDAPAETPVSDAAADANADLPDLETSVIKGDTAGEGSELDKLMPEEGPEQAKEIDWESYLEDGFDAGDRQTEEMDSPDERFERVPVYSKTLQDHLLAQLQDRHIDPKIAPLVEYLIHSLDDRGWLTPEVKRDTASEELEAKAKAEGEDDEDDEMIGGDLLFPELEKSETPKERTAVETAHDALMKRDTAAILPERPEYALMQAIIEGSTPLETASLPIREAFHILQSLEPAGIGARNLRECLLLQLERSSTVSPLARRIVKESFDLLERLKIAAMAKKFEVAPDQIQAAVREIGTLEPHPGRLLGSSTATPVIPDLLVENIDGELVLMLNDKTIPSLKVSKAYAQLLKKGSRATADEKRYVRDKLNSATWLIRAIEQRKSTMIKVMHAIMSSQPEFFQKGPAHLNPLILQDVADKIGMHISTVSRVTNGKYVQTPNGIFELKYFFTAGVTQSDGSEVSSVAAKDEIKKLIEGEDARKPLSDQKIVEILKNAGIDVARRTVAKYRDQLEILPARLRKSY
jgi:RNA polymerase sigma-54 factor